MWRRLLWWSSERPAVLPWAIFLSLVLLVSSDSFRLGVSGTVVRFVYAPFVALRYRVLAGAEVFEDNRTLTHRIAALEIDNQRLREAASENVRLRELMGFVPGWKGRVIPAEVISPLLTSSGTIWIANNQTVDYQKNWPIVTDRGLLGRIIEVADDRSRIRTLWDRLLRVSAYVKRSRVGGIVAWESGTTVLLKHVSRSADVVIGDTVLSSGWGEIFPKGLLIGSVSAIDSVPNSDFLRISVLPSASPNHLEAVFVVLPLTEDSTAMRSSDE